LSRHRKIQFSRSKAILVAAGAFSVVTAASVTAPTWTSGTSGASGHRDGSASGAAGTPLLTVTDQLARPPSDLVAQQTSVSFVQRAYQVRLVEAKYAVAQWKSAQERAARKAAAARAAAVAAQSQAAAQAPVAVQTPAAAETPAAAQPTSASTVTAQVPSGSPQQIAEAMLGSFGWSSSQFSCLDPLWAHESGWSVSAYNASSGAFGIPQALPGSRMASAGPDWQTNAATQIRWGLEYIKGTYGSPCGAWAHEQATGWY
jgi:hypothetical protein